MLIGMPSMTYNGELLALTEPVPRILTTSAAPGWPEVLITSPVVFAASAAVNDARGLFSIFSADTTLAEPVNDSLLVTP